MQARRGAAGRPSGTDGSDFSYRMVVDSRYTKVGKYKIRLSRLFFIQGLILLVGCLSMLLPVTKGEDPDVLALSSVILSFVSLILGESGRRHSKSTLLKLHLILSIGAMFLSVACAVKSTNFFEAFKGGIGNIWEQEKILLVGTANVFLGVLLQILTANTTLSLLHNMSPPKRSS